VCIAQLLYSAMDVALVSPSTPLPQVAKPRRHPSQKPPHNVTDIFGP